MPTSKSSFPADSNGNTIPLLPVLYGASTERNVAIGGIAAYNLADSIYTGQIVRLWSFNFPLYYKIGAAAVAQATLADAYIPKDGYMDVPLSAGETHIRAIGVGGTAVLRIELLGK